VSRYNKRTGIAVSDSVFGPWERFDKPLINTRADYYDNFLISNAAPCQCPDGKILVVYKSVGYMQPPYSKLADTRRTVHGNVQKLGAVIADSLDGDYTVFNSKSIGRVTDNDRPTSEILKLKIGMRVMAVKNDSEGRYQNGSLGTVKRISKDKSVVCVGFDNGDTADIEMHCWEIDAYKLNEENDKVEAKPVGEYESFSVKME
jgi:hypothetical protein